MKLEGGCYCGKVRYVAEGEPMMKAQCHCRECQYITGGSTNMFLVMPIAGFKYTRTSPEAIHPHRPGTRGDAGILRRMRHPCRDAPAGPARRGRQGRHARRSQPVHGPQIAIYTVDKQPYHHVPEGMPAFERLPQR